MYYKLYKDGVLINCIKANIDFADFYCKMNGYTYEEYDEPTPQKESKIETINISEIEEILIDQEYRILLLEYGIYEEEV